MSPLSITAQQIPAQPSASATSKAELRTAAMAFEAMMLGQLLKSAMPAPAGSSGDWHSIALDGFARELSASQPFGLARLLETQT